MLFEQRFWAGLTDGSITMTFRRWKRRQVVAGNRYRTPAGILEVEAVDIVDAAEITDREARRAGYPSTADDVATIDARLDRLDRASTHGPWTAAALAAIAKRPGVRAADLAESFGRETKAFKTDVRKLKNLGLTLSLEVGYRLSPRGSAYRRSTRRRAPKGA